MCSICDGDDWLLAEDEIEIGIEDGQMQIEVNTWVMGFKYHEIWNKKINYCPNCGKDLREGKNEQ
jgi:hypothetical protein